MQSLLISKITVYTGDTFILVTSRAYKLGRALQKDRPFFVSDGEPISPRRSSGG